MLLLLLLHLRVFFHLLLLLMIDPVTWSTRVLYYLAWLAWLWRQIFGKMRLIHQWLILDVWIYKTLLPIIFLLKADIVDNPLCTMITSHITRVFLYSASSNCATIIKVAKLSTKTVILWLLIIRVIFIVTNRVVQAISYLSLVYYLVWGLNLW